MQTNSGQMVFETGLGFVGIAWSAAGLTRLCLLPARPDRHRAPAGKAGRCRRRRPKHRTGLGRGTCPRHQAYAEGEEVDFSNVPVDLAGVDDFRLAIYEAARKLGFGETTTYGELAKRAGHAGLARETGQALGANPVPLIIPCHRILAAGGKIGGFSAPGGSTTKERMLALEGVRVGPPPAPQQSFGF